MSSEISINLEADVVCVTEGSIRTTVSLNLRSWNIAASSGIWQGDVSPTGSETVALDAFGYAALALRIQTDTMETREGQSVLHWEVCDVKPMNGEASQMTFWGSDQFIVPSVMLATLTLPWKQGNSCGGKGLAEEALGQGHIFRTQMRVKDGNKTGLITYLINDREVSSEEPDEEKPHVLFCEGAHSNPGAITPAGGAL